MKILQRLKPTKRKVFLTFLIVLALIVTENITAQFSGGDFLQAIYAVIYAHLDSYTFFLIADTIVRCLTVYLCLSLVLKEER